MTIEPDDAGQGFESALRRGLGRRAGGPVAPGDLGDLSGRIAASGRRRQRIMALAAVLALIAGATGGYVVSRSTAATAGATSASRSGSFAPGVAGDSVATTTPGRQGAAAAMAPCSGAGLPASAEVGSATHLFNRTTADGITIRVYRNAAVSGCGPLSNGSTVSSGSASTGPVSTGSASTGPVSTGSGPALCTSGPSVSFGFSDDTAVGQGSLSSSEVFNPAASGVSSGSSSAVPSTTSPVTTTAPPTTTTLPTTTTTPSTPPAPPVAPPTTTPGPVGIGAPASGAFGVAEGDPVWWVALRITSGNVAAAVATFSDGSTDRMAPVDGVVVLAHHVATATAAAGTGPYAVEAKVQLLDSSGATLLTVTFPLVAPTPVPMLPTPGILPGSTATTGLPGAVSPPASVGSSVGSGPQKRSSTLPGAQAVTGATGTAGGQVVIACPDIAAPGLP